MRAERFGSLAAALTVGLKVQKKDASGVVQDYTDSAPIKANAGFGIHCFDVDIKAWGAGDELLLCRWSFDKAGEPISLESDKGEYLALVVNDDLSLVVAASCTVQGVIAGGPVEEDFSTRIGA